LESGSGQKYIWTEFCEFFSLGLGRLTLISWGEADQTSRNKANEILIFYLRKRKVDIHLIRIREFGSPEVKLTNESGNECDLY